MSVKSVLQSISEVLLKGLKATATQLIIAAENSIEGTSGTEKRATVVSQLDEYIDLPSWLEWADNIALGLLVDAICDRLNLLCDHDWSGISDEEAAAEAVAVSLEESDEDVTEATADAQTVDEKFAALLAKYGVVTDAE